MVLALEVAPHGTQVCYVSPNGVFTPGIKAFVIARKARDPKAQIADQGNLKNPKRLPTGFC
jgi:hypothetical protein